MTISSNTGSRSSRSLSIIKPVKGRNTLAAKRKGMPLGLGR